MPEKASFLKDHDLTFWSLILAVLLYQLCIIPTIVTTLHADTLNISTSAFMLTSAVFCLVFSIVVYLGLHKIPAGYKKLFYALGLLSVLFAFYNFYFLDYKGKIIDADHDVFHQNYSIIEYTSFLAAFIFCLFSAKKLYKLFRLAICIFVFTGATTIVVNAVTAPSAKKIVPQDSSLINDRLYQFSTNENFIHIILDGLEGYVFEKVISEYPQLAEKLDGFEFFPDTLATSEVSYLSIGTVFSGKPFVGNQGVRDYLSSVGMDDAKKLTIDTIAPVFQSAKIAGYDIDILAAPGAGLKERAIYRSYAYTDFGDENENQNNGLLKLTELTLVKTLPWHLKRRVYYNGKWLFSYQKSLLPRANRAHKFLDDFEKKLVTKNDKPTYKMLHFLSPHGPWTTSSECNVLDNPEQTTEAVYNQSKCAIVALTQFLDGLKSKGVYNQSNIIVHGDHGICYRKKLNTPSKKLPYCLGNANPALLVKPENNTRPFAKNLALMSLTDIKVLVDSALEGQMKSYLATLVQNQNRIRRYYRFEPNRVSAYKLNRVDTVFEFEVKGPFAEASSWNTKTSQKTAAIEDINAGQILNIDRIGRSSQGIWVIWEGKGPTEKHYIESGEQRLPINIMSDHFTFAIPQSYPETDIYLVDADKQIKQRLRISETNSDNTVISQITTDKVFDIELLQDGTIFVTKQVGKSETGVWVQWEEANLNNAMYILINGNALPIYISESHFTFKLPGDAGESPIYLVDPISKVKQKLDITTPE